MKTKIKIHHYKEVESTNDVLKKLAKQGAKEYTLVLADKQTRGRGRFDRSWISDEGGLWMSLLLKPKISLQKVPLISLVASLGVAKSIRELTQLDAETKWPNDVLINSKKVCGILPESGISSGKLEYLILGIGVNVNQEKFPPELKDVATSIRLIMKSSFPKDYLFEDIISTVGDLYFEMLEEGASRIIEEWKDLCPLLNHDIMVKEGNQKYSGIMKDISENGHLLLEQYDENIIEISAGEATAIV